MGRVSDNLSAQSRTICPWAARDYPAAARLQSVSLKYLSALARTNSPLYSRGMQTVSDIFAIWPSLSTMAEELGEPYNTVQKWHARNRIPVTAWPRIIEKAARRERLLTMADMAALNIPKQRRRA